MGLLPPVVATLLADTKEYSTKMTEADAKMKELGSSADSTGAKFGKFASKASTAVLGLGVALGGYALDKAYTFQEGLDKIQNQAGLTAAAADKLGKQILNISSATGIATPDLLNAGLAVEQAGIRGAKASQMLAAAAKTAVITGQSVVTVTQALVAAETLHVAKSMRVANLAGLMVAGSKQIVGGFGAEAQMLQGRVGVALASVGMKMNDIIAAGAEFSKAGLNSRAVTSFATGIAKLELPLTRVHVTAKKTYTTLSTYALSLQAVGLSQQKLVSDLRTGGIPALLTDIKDAAGSSVPKLQELLHVVFGPGAGTSQVLLNNLKQFDHGTKSLGGAGAGTLQTGFAKAMTQLGPQLNQLKAKLDVLMIDAGMKLLPALTHVAKWGDDVIKYFEKHPLFSEVMSHVAMDTFAAALTYKLATGMKKVFQNVFGSVPMTANTNATNLNTDALTRLTESMGGNTVKSLTGEGAAAVGGADVAGGVSLGTSALVGGAGALGLIALMQLMGNKYGHNNKPYDMFNMNKMHPYPTGGLEPLHFNHTTHRGRGIQAPLGGTLTINNRSRVTRG